MEGSNGICLFILMQVIVSVPHVSTRIRDRPLQSFGPGTLLHAVRVAKELLEQRRREEVQTLEKYALAKVDLETAAQESTIVAEAWRRFGSSKHKVFGGGHKKRPSVIPMLGDILCKLCRRNGNQACILRWCAHQPRVAAPKLHPVGMLRRIKGLAGDQRLSNNIH